MPSFSSWHWVYSMLCSCFHKYEINIRVNIGDVLLCKTSLNSYHQINSCVCSDSGLHMTHKPLIFDCLQTRGAVTLPNTAPEELPCRFHVLQDVSGNMVGFFSPTNWNVLKMSWGSFCSCLQHWFVLCLHLSEGDTGPQLPLLSGSSSHSVFCVGCSFFTVCH